MSWPETSWSVFEACGKCDTKKGKPCFDLRNKAFTIGLPHRGRKQIAPRKRNRY